MINDLTSKFIGAAIRVHQALGPGLLESAYRSCLAYELQQVPHSSSFLSGPPRPVRLTTPGLPSEARFELPSLRVSQIGDSGFARLIHKVTVYAPGLAHFSHIKRADLRM